MVANGMWLKFEYLHLFEQDPLQCGAELGVGRESGDRPEARGESKSLELKPSFPGCFEDICHGRRIEHIFIRQCVSLIYNFCIFDTYLMGLHYYPFALAPSSVRDRPVSNH